MLQVLEIGVDDARDQFVVDTVHVDGTVEILEFVEWPCGVVVARRVAGKRRADDQWQRLGVL